MSLRFMTAGESHGPGMLAVIEGLPAGLEVDLDFIDAELRRRSAAISREVDELRANSPLVGTPGEIADRLGEFADAGVERVYLQLLDLADLDHLELFASEVIPHFSG